jgi:hypothetical protein
VSFSPLRYDDYQTIRAGEAHRLERRHAHARALKDFDFAKQGLQPRSSLRDSMLALLQRLRPESRRPATPRIADHDLTDYVCRLEDGSMGRVAIILGVDDEWTAVCVRT